MIAASSPEFIVWTLSLCHWEQSVSPGPRACPLTVLNPEIVSRRFHVVIPSPIQPHANISETPSHRSSKTKQNLTTTYTRTYDWYDKHHHYPTSHAQLTRLTARPCPTPLSHTTRSSSYAPCNQKTQAPPPPRNHSRRERDCMCCVRVVCVCVRDRRLVHRARRLVSQVGGRGTRSGTEAGGGSVGRSVGRTDGRVVQTLRLA